ncbi:hypothetical protein GCG54_00012394 [Colletotrichum gloeosporioides]|uniref:Major facilitator superfamily transporter n=1 Tax=Colletotrichum gloeosporioides TaxID=474922 RepID=A0A8H4CE57_COLGL|nr:uncharacterized protein GCG54_00012394 [Colletotrichum gloeosporioides]KAF3802148.1 hypothetical protein GCG54_00012394 [Colletotrichum gloeosporioides]
MSIAKEGTYVEHDDHPTVVKRKKYEAEAESLQDSNRFRTSKSLVRKLDVTLVPIIWVMYLFSYLNHTAIAYMIMQISSNRLLTSAHPSLYLPFWGLLFLHAFTNPYLCDAST